MDSLAPHDVKELGAALAVRLIDQCRGQRWSVTLVALTIVVESVIGKFDRRDVFGDLIDYSRSLQFLRWLLAGNCVVVPYRDGIF